MLGAMDAALDLLPTMDEDRARLAGFGDRVRADLTSRGFDVGASTTQIVPIIVGGTEKALTLSMRLEEKGIIAAAIRPPTVPSGSARLRVSLSAAHEPADVDGVVAALRATA